MWRSVFTFPLLFVLLASPVEAEDTSAAEAWTALKAEAAEGLAALAREAQGRKLFRTRDEIYEQVLVFATDHEKARSWLKFKRRKGVWVQIRYTRPRDRGSKTARLGQAEAARAWRAWWRSEVIRVHEQAASEGAAGVAAEILRFALEMDGEDPALRELAGEVRHGAGPNGRWILIETQRALANRARFLDAARRATQAVRPVEPHTPRPENRSGTVAWPTALEGETVLVLGAVSPEELQRHLAIAEAAAPVFSAVFGIEAHLPSENVDAGTKFPLYVAAGRKQGNAFLANEPGIGDGGLALLAHLEMAFLPTRPGAVVKTGSSPRRWEATAHAVQAHLTRLHLGHEPGASRGAWAQEAVSLYLAWLQVRTRDLCTVRDAAPSSRAESPEATGPFGRPRRGVDDGAVQLSDATTDWHARAAEAIRELDVSDLRRMGAKGASDLDALDLLAGYGLGVYVLEVHPTRSAAFFREVASQPVTDLDAALCAHLGTDLETLHPHLLRWLDEMGTLAPPPDPPR